MAYPGLAFRRRSRNWWARLIGQAPECVHLETEYLWTATLVPDTVYLRGKDRAVRKPPRPDVCLCRGCLMRLLEPELAAFEGRVVAFEPDYATATQYFFVSSEDFEAAGLTSELSAAIKKRLRRPAENCERCERRAKWLWLDHGAVTSLDDIAHVEGAPGQWLCASHGASAMCRSLKSIDELNLFYINLPYGDAGAYVWI
jgi:hypothetical protein